MTERVLLTGATGFIAKHILRELLGAGYDVRATTRSLDREAELRAAAGAALDDDARLEVVAIDLTQDAGWAEAMAGVDILMHTASPFPLSQPDDAEALIRPAVDGTLRALRAAKAAGVTRVVLTSSIAAISSAALADGRTVYDERDWTDPDDPTSSPYVLSKTLAERAAWDFVAENPEMRLTVINPGFVLGPPIDDHFGTSMQVIQRILSARDPMQPAIGFPTVDVRDIAAAHVRALSVPEAEGQRFAVAGDFMWMKDIAQAIADALPDRKVRTREAPDWLVRVIARFDKAAKGILPQLRSRRDVSSQRARDVLGLELRPGQQAAGDAARRLIELGAA